MRSALELEHQNMTMNEIELLHDLIDDAISELRDESHAYGVVDIRERVLSLAAKDGEEELIASAGDKLDQLIEEVREKRLPMDRLFDEHCQFITDRFGEEAAARANYGWNTGPT